MTRRSVLLGIALFVLLAVGTGAVLLLLLHHEPDFYQRIAQPPGQERQKHSEEFTAKCTSLLNGMINNREWEERFTEAQINSYLDEDFIRSGIHERMLPEGISQPRVSIAPDKVRLAFRYGSAPWCSTIVSIDFRVWLPTQSPELNVVALELQGLHAGSLPISAQSLLERISDAARRQDIEVTWYRHEGNPVALLRLQANQPRPTVRLEKIQLYDGLLILGGHSVEAAPLRAMLGVPIPASSPGLGLTD
jgi:hypothetical protein